MVSIDWLIFVVGFGSKSSYKMRLFSLFQFSNKKERWKEREKRLVVLKNSFAKYIGLFVVFLFFIIIIFFFLVNEMKEEDKMENIYREIFA